MRKLTFRSLCSILLLLFPLLTVQPALAHGGEPRLEVSVERINPGGLVDVRGVDFDSEQSVSLSLTSSETEIALAELTADEEGVFTQTVVLPADLPAGEYNFLARTDHHTITSPAITVWGTAVQNQEDTGIRDQSDVQLEPIPALAGVSSTPTPQTTASQVPAAAGSSTVLIYSLALGIAIVSLLGIRMLNKR